MPIQSLVARHGRSNPQETLSLTGSQDTANGTLIIEIEEVLSILENRMESVNAFSMLEASHEALRLSEKIGYQRGILKANFVLGLSYYYAGDYKNSLRHFTAIDTIGAADFYPHYRTLMHQGKGDLFQDVGLDDWAKLEYKKGIASAQTINNDNYKHIILSLIYADLAKMYYDPDDSLQMDTLSYYLDKTEKELKLVDRDFIFPIAPIYLSLRSVIYIRQNQFELAKACIDELFGQIKTYKNVDSPYIYLTAGVYYENVHQPDSAEYYYRRALRRSNESGVVKDLPSIYKQLSEFFKKHEHPDSAYYYHQLYIDTENSHASHKLASSKEILNLILRDVEEQNNKNKKTIPLLALVITYAVAFATATGIYLYLRQRSKSKNEKRINQLNRQLNHAFDEVIELAKKNDPTFITRFQEVYPEFWNKLNRTHPDLTPAELDLCAKTYLNFTTQQIADFAFLQVRSIQTRRSRLRKKINLAPQIDLLHYLNSLDNE